MAAALPLARLGVALAQAACDLADQPPHLLDLPRLDPRQWRVGQDFVAQVFGKPTTRPRNELRYKCVGRVALAAIDRGASGKSTMRSLR